MSDLSQNVTPDRPCYRYRTDAATPPCEPCPLYGAYLERCGRADTPANRAAYAAFVAAGCWPLYWSIHRLERRLEHRARVLTLVRRYPRAGHRLAELLRSETP